MLETNFSSLVFNSSFPETLLWFLKSEAPPDLRLIALLAGALFFLIYYFTCLDFSSHKLAAVEIEKLFYV